MAKKHTKGKRVQSMTMFGYRFEVYENVIIIYDNENQEKSVEMMHHTFEHCIKLYTQAKAKK